MLFEGLGPRASCRYTCPNARPQWLNGQIGAREEQIKGTRTPAARYNRAVAHPRRLVFVGEVVIDVTTWVPALPVAGGDVLATAATLTPGGGFNVMAAAARQGIPVVFAGRHGTGVAGATVRAALAAEGVEIAGAADSGADTGFVVTMVSPDGERTFVTTPEALSGLDAAGRAAVPAVSGDLVYVSGYGLLAETGDELASWVSNLDASISVVVDPGALAGELPRPALDVLLARADWWSCNRREAEQITGVADPAGAGAVLAERRATGRGGRPGRRRRMRPGATGVERGGGEGTRTGGGEMDRGAGRRGDRHDGRRRRACRGVRGRPGPRAGPVRGGPASHGRSRALGDPSRPGDGARCRGARPWARGVVVATRSKPRDGADCVTVPADTAGFVFRPATSADVPAVVELVQSAYRGESSRAGWTTEADLLDGVRTDAATLDGVLADPRSQLLLLTAPPAARTSRPAAQSESDAKAPSEGGAEAEGEDLLACCHIRDDGGRAYFGLFAVRPGRQGGGIGRALLTEAQRRAVQRWGAQEMWMTVIAQRQDLIAWYERLGFGLTGETRPFPYGDERFGRPKRADLEFAVLTKPLP